MGTIDRHGEMRPGYMCSVCEGTWFVERAWMETIQEMRTQGQDIATFGEQFKTSLVGSNSRSMHARPRHCNVL